MSQHSHFSFLPQRLTLSWHVRDLRILKILPPRRRRLEGMGNSAMSGVLLLELLIAVSNGDIIDGYFQSRLYCRSRLAQGGRLFAARNRDKSRFGCRKNIVVDFVSRIVERSLRHENPV